MILEHFCQWDAVVSRVPDPLLPHQHLRDAEFFAVRFYFFDVYLFAGGFMNGVHKQGAWLLVYQNGGSAEAVNNLPVRLPHPRT